jgi:hypothetical protein
MFSLHAFHPGVYALNAGRPLQKTRTTNPLHVDFIPGTLAYEFRLLQTEASMPSWNSVFSAGVF